MIIFLLIFAKQACFCSQNKGSKSGCTERTVLDLEEHRLMMDDLQEHASGLESENQKLKNENELLHQKTQNLTENLSNMKIENERLSSEEKRLNTRNKNLWKRLQGQEQKDSEIATLKTENANLIAANEKLLVERSKTDEALKKIKEDLDEAKREKTELQEKLNIERKRNYDLQSGIEQCRSDEKILRDEIKEEKARCSRTTQDLKNDLEQRKNETEILEEQLSIYEKEIQSLKLESEDCFGRENNSLMVLASYGAQQEISYVLKPDGSAISREIKMPTSIHGYHYLYYSISALIRGQVYIFGGFTPEYRFKISTISGCEVIELDAKLKFGYNWASSVVTAADQQSAMICFSNDEEWKHCEEFNGRAFSTKPSTKFTHGGSCLALFHDQPVAVGSFLRNGYKKVEKFNGASWTELPEFPRAIHFHSCIGVYDGYLILGGRYHKEYKRQWYYYQSLDVYSFRFSKWTVVGKLNEVHHYSSSIRFGNTIYLIGGSRRPSAVEKLEWNGEEILSSKVINDHNYYYSRPIIFPVDEFFCA